MVLRALPNMIEIIQAAVLILSAEVAEVQCAVEKQAVAPAPLNDRPSPTLPKQLPELPCVLPHEYLNHGCHSQRSLKDLLILRLADVHNDALQAITYLSRDRVRNN